jgi:hypothetical protein
LRSVVIALALLASAACKKARDPEQTRIDDNATSSNVVVRVEVRGRSLSELEQQVAIPLEKAVTGITNVTAIDATISGHTVELVLTVAPREDARVISQEVARRVASTTPTPNVILEPTSDRVSRFVATKEQPTAIAAPGVHRVHTCGPERVREIVVDGAQLAASKLTLDDVFEAIEKTGGRSLDDVSYKHDVDASPCRVVLGGTHLASVHYDGNSEMYATVMRLGWTVPSMLGNQVEIIIAVSEPEPGIVERFATAVRDHPKVSGVIAMEEPGPPNTARIIFHGKYDADAREIANSAVAAVPGTHLLEVRGGEYSGQQAEAIVTGTDRRDVLVRARTALAAVAPIDPEGGAGCIGCEVQSQLVLELVESSAAIAPRIGDLLHRNGIEVAAADGVPTRLRIVSGAELSPETIGRLPVRDGRGGVVPLSSLGTLTLADRPSVLLRHDGKPAVIVWKRSWKSTVGDSQETLAKALPDAVLRVVYTPLW